MWIFINKKNIGGKLQKVAHYGNLKLLVDENEVKINGKVLDHWQTRVFLKKQKNAYEDENLFIKKAEIKKSKKR